MWAESTSMPMCGNSARMMRAACRPSSLWPGGMRTSIRTTSGRCARTLRSRSSRSPAWPTTSKPACSSTRTVPARSRTESSAMTTRKGSSTPGSRRSARVSNCVTGGYMPPKLRLDGRPRNRRDGWVYRARELVAGLDVQLPADLETECSGSGAEPQHDLVHRVVVVVLGGNDCEAAFGEHAQARDVVLGDTRPHGTLAHLREELGHSARGIASSPVLAADPVSDQPLVVRGPAADVPDHLPILNDRPGDHGDVGEDPRPVPVV